jgi:hypothetical protein
MAAGVAVHTGSQRDLLRHILVCAFVSQGPGVDGCTGFGRFVVAFTACAAACGRKFPLGVLECRHTCSRKILQEVAARQDLAGGEGQLRRSTSSMARLRWSTGFIWVKKGASLWPGFDPRRQDRDVGEQGVTGGAAGVAYAGAVAPVCSVRASVGALMWLKGVRERADLRVSRNTRRWKVKGTGA